MATARELTDTFDDVMRALDHDLADRRSQPFDHVGIFRIRWISGQGAMFGKGGEEHGKKQGGGLPKGGGAHRRAFASSIGSRKLGIPAAC